MSDAEARRDLLADCVLPPNLEFPSFLSFFLSFFYFFLPQCELSAPWVDYWTGFAAEPEREWGGFVAVAAVVAGGYLTAQQATSALRLLRFGHHTGGGLFPLRLGSAWLELAKVPQQPEPCPLTNGMRKLTCGTVRAAGSKAGAGSWARTLA